MSSAQRPSPRVGLFDRPFWDHAAAGELRLQRCVDCGAWRYPPAAVCPECLSSGCEWQALSGRAQLVAWTVFHRQYFPELPVPYTVVSVRTEEGPLLVGNLLGDVPAPLRPGLALQLCFEEVHAQGQPWTLPQWRLALPDEGASR